MNPFEYQRAADLQVAVNDASTHSRFLAGGTNLIDLMKNYVETPAKLIDINHLKLAAIEPIPDGGLRLGALATNTATANHPLVREHYPLLAQAILSGASAQLRNMATNGGNLLQRTRCAYFMDPAFPQCNKRCAGSGCGAVEGFNRRHAIFGASEHCIAVHPSDMCVALAVLEAVINVYGPEGNRQIPISEFHRLPGDRPELDTNLKPKEIVTSIDLPISPYAAHYHYLKVRDRASYEFALISVAVGLELDQGHIISARLALGGVAHKPWALEKVEYMLAGQKLNKEIFERAAWEAIQDAVPQRHNVFKIEMVKRGVAEALGVAGGLV